MKLPKISCLLVLAISTALYGVTSSAPRNVEVAFRLAYPESLSSTQDGSLYIGSMGLGAVYIAAPQARKASTFISKQAGGFGRVLGVLADPASHRLWICDNDDTRATLKTFDLKTGAKLKAYDFPGGGFCNDIALKGGDAYVTDTKNGRILKLEQGHDQLSVWFTNPPSDPSLDGLVWKAGDLYTNTYNGNHLIQITTNRDGSAKKATVLKPSMDIFQPDGMRLSRQGEILLVEGRGNDGNGRLDAVRVDGDKAQISVIKDHFMLPTAVTTVGDTAYVLEAKLNYQRDPALKGKDPGIFHVFAVALK